MGLSGNVTTRILMDRASIEAFKDQVFAAAKIEGEDALLELADEAVEFLAQLERARGHDFLAGEWTHTAVMQTPEGPMVEAYSKAEDQTFYARSGPNRTRSQAYPIKGEKLLQLLEGGAAAHTIAPRSEEGLLAFPGRVGEHASIFEGTRLLRRHGLAERSFLGRAPNATIFTRQVNHPGFAGNRFIETTRLFIEQSLAQRADQIAKNISTRLA